MIRINLLGERKKQRIVLKAPSGPPKSSFLIILFLAVFVVAGAYLFLRYQSLNHQLEDLQTQVSQAQKEKVRKQQLLKAIDEFEKRRQVLEGRIAIIDQLKKNQLGPMEWLNGLSQAVDRSQSVWLTNVNQSGTRMKIEGVATSLNGVANFATVLKGSTVFQNVTIDETELTSVSGFEGYAFTISCDTKIGAPGTQS